MMHAIKGGWVGQTFALAAYSDSGGRKARIRRSKEERKAMVESFIKKYQNSNNGNFPSLNLTHKEVGGSFYTVREIVREIIQENKVLGPAKFSEEQSYDNVLEHYPLGSISIEAQRSSLPSDELKSVIHISSKQRQGTGEELVANSNGLFFGYEHQNLDSDQVVNGVIETIKDDVGSDGPKNVAHTSSKQSLDSGEEVVANSSGQSFVSEHQKLHNDQVVNGAVETIKDDLGSDECSLIEAAIHTHEGTSDEILENLSGQLTGPDCQEFDSKPIGDVSEPTDEDEESNEPVIRSPVSIPNPRVIQEDHQESRGEQVVHSTIDFPGDGHLKADTEEDVNGISQAIGETEYEQPVLAVAVGEDSLDVNKGGTKTVESSNVGMTRGQADIVVEKFPLHPIARKFDDLEGRLEEQSQGTRTLEVNKIEQDSVQVTEHSCSAVQVEAGADLAVSKSKSELVGKTASLNDGNPPLEMSNCSATKKVPVFDMSNAAEIGAKVSSPTEAKPANVPTGTNEKHGDINAGVSHEQSIPDETIGIEDKLKIEGDSSSKEGSNPTLNRINLETWERTSELPAESEVNPVFAFFKALVTAFVRFLNG